jgi:hypothetical protein
MLIFMALDLDGVRDADGHVAGAETVNCTISQPSPTGSSSLL